jgi:hypothetical protein
LAEKVQRKMRNDIAQLAQQLSDPKSRRTMLRLAEDYERLAEQAKLRARRQSQSSLS